MRRLPVVVSLAWLMGASLAACQSNAPTPAADSGKTEAAAEIDVEALLEGRTFPLLLWSAYSVQQEYFDADRFDGREQLDWALHELGLRFPELFAELHGNTVKITVGEARETIPFGELGTPLVAAEVLEKVLLFARDNLELADDEAVHRLEYTAINGFLSPLDPHTILLTPEERSDLGIRTKGQFGGIGAEIVPDKRRIRVVRVLPKSPAEAAGLQPDDLILQIAGESTVNMAAVDAQHLLRGPIDTEVSLKVQRGAEVLTITITRKIIRIDSVVPTRLPGDVAYLRVTTFQENTGEQAATAIQDMQKEAPLKAVILDLRGNTGGLLTQAIAVLDLFIKEGELVIVRSALGREAEAAKPETLVGDEVAVIALVDEEAASASEIVSGTLGSLGRGLVLGRRSFGKGTVQMLKPLAPYGRELALKMTVAEYQVAGDKRIQTVGVAPDLVLSPVDVTELAGIARYYDTERFERLRERLQVAHLPSARHDPALKEAPKDDALLRYLGDRRDVADGEPDALADPEVAIAREVALAVAGSATPEARREALAGIRGELAAREDAAIVDRLGAQRVAWAGTVGASGDPELEIKAVIPQLHRRGEDGEVTPIGAGEPFDLKVEVTNRSDAPAERLHLITECVHDELDGIELLIGTVPPGESVRREVSLKVMPWHPDFAEELRLDVHSGEPGETPDATATLRLEVAGQERSDPSYDWWIVDDPKLVAAAPERPQEEGPAVGEPFAVTGNGDGVLQPGERVLLALRARNRGDADAKTVRALLRNKSGAQGLLEEGFGDLGKIKAGAEVRGAFGVSVAEKPDLKAPLELDLMVADVHLRAAARERLELRIVDRRPELEPLAGDARRVQVKAEGARLYNGADGKSPVLGELPGGAVLEVVGRAGGWLALDLEPGRRAWVPADLTEPAPAKAKRTPLPERPALLVSPPKLEIKAPPRVVKDARLTIEATATHARRVRDVVVAVAAVGPGEVEKKVFFRANPARDGDGARSMTIEAEVPLVAGGNRITITARDGDDVEATEELLVFRE